jgi:hypothetical protein
VCWRSAPPMGFLYVGRANLENSPHGLNTYQGYDVAVIVSALNPAPYHQHFMMSVLGSSKAEIHTGIHKATIYQAVTRISIRDPANKNPKTIIVPDRATALWLQEHFPGSTVEALGIDGGDEEETKGGRVRIHVDNAAKCRAYRLRQRLRQRLEQECCGDGEQ